jgi:lipopolysaccharide biosynthesis glycosyltransferase
MVETIPIFIGFDKREAIAYHVCCQSIVERASMPVEFHPLHLGLFSDYTETHTDGSNAFIYSRFLVPWLMSWKGWAIFMDGDMIVKDDIAKLWAERDLYKAVQVVKHDYKTKHPTKYLGNKNEDYPRKNWSSVVLWNCNHFGNRILIPEYVEKATGSHLHQFRWLEDKDIGDLPKTWNHLVREEEDQPSSLNHYTIGLPCFPDYDDGSQKTSEWWNEYTKTVRPL